MELILPTTEYKTSFIEAVKEYQEHPDTDLRSLQYRDLSIAELEADFGGYVEKIKSNARGENLPEGWVPSTVFWLVDGGEFLGRVSIRHRLTEHLEKIGGHIGYDIRPSQRGKGHGNTILALALLKAQELGISRALLTCDETNIISRKVIEKNGGVFEDHATDPATGVNKLRFWIENT